MTEKTEDRLRKVHDRALERFDRCYSSQRDMRLRCVQDRRFVFVEGAQFEGDLEQQFANRPKFEFNKCHQSVIRAFSEYRNNRVTVDFRPEDKKSSEATAEFLDGLYRADEQDSGGQEAYDTAFEEGVAGGMGAWRLVNKYEDDEDEESDRRRISLEPIPDADQSVFFDIDAKKYDKCDATYCFVISGMQPDVYGDEHGEDAPDAVIKEWKSRRNQAKAKNSGNITSFDKVTRMTCYDWFTPDVIYVAEYFELEEVKELVAFYHHPASGEERKVKGKDAIAQEGAELEKQGFRLVRTKKVRTRKVHKYIIDGNKVLEDCGLIAGKHIPVVPYYAKRLFVDNVERIIGHIRLATDAQRLYNMLVSLLAEISVRSPVEKPIFTPQQIQGHEAIWANDDVKRYPYLLVNPTMDPATGQMMPAGPIGYVKPPQIPPALAALIQLIGVDLKEVLGNSENATEVVSNISAKAVELIQNRLDMQTFIYMDNFKKSMRRCGEIWLSMARDLYDEDDREMRVVNLDGSDDIAMLREPAVDDDQEHKYVNDPTSGKFRVVADVGPSFTTRRDGTVRAITGMMQFIEDPADKAVLAGVAIQNLEGEGLSDVKSYFRRKSIAAGVTKPTEAEAKEIEEAKAAAANQPPDAQTQFLLAEAEKSLANARKADADAQLALQRISESEAKVAEILSKIESGEFNDLMQFLKGEREEAQPEPTKAAETVPA